MDLMRLEMSDQEFQNHLNKNITWGFPGGAVVEHLSANAGDHGFEPWSGRIPHAAEQLGP